MPRTLIPRQAQIDAFERAKERNTIVNLPTGVGKTLIAIMLIEHYLEVDRAKKILFIVPKKSLVNQQAKAIEKETKRSYTVRQLCGMSMDRWTYREWAKCLSQSSILVGTPEVFRHAIVDLKCMDLEDFSLLVFDECHHAVGNDPMVGICNDGLKEIPDKNKRPRVLGLTASFVNGKVENLFLKRNQLEETLHSTVFSPSSVDVTAVSNEITYSKVDYEKETLPLYIEAVERKLNTLFEQFQGLGLDFKDPKKVISRALHVYQTLGKSGFLFFLQASVIPQLYNYSVALLSDRNPVSNRDAEVRSLVQRLPQEQQRFYQYVRNLGEALTEVPEISFKFQKLKRLVADIFIDQRAKGVENCKGIIFVEWIALTFPIKYMLELEGFRAGAITGGSATSESDLDKTLDAFKQHKLQILVSTNALEEGLDVDTCIFVVRFEKFNTTRGHIQGSGRVRAKNGVVYYFDNNPIVEEQNRALINACARNEEYGLSEDQIEFSEALSLSKDVPGVHPFRRTPDAGEINVFNCTQIVNQYIQQVLRHNMPTEKHRIYDEQVICEHPRKVIKTLMEVIVPTPDGELSTALEEVESHWGNVAVEHVVDLERIENWSSSDLELRRFMFVVAIELSKLGFLDDRNRATQIAIHKTGLKCGPYVHRGNISLKNNFPKGNPAGCTLSSLEDDVNFFDRTDYKGDLEEWARSKELDLPLIHCCGSDGFYVARCFFGSQLHQAD